MALSGHEEKRSKDEGRTFTLIHEDTSDRWEIDPPWFVVSELDAIVDDADFQGTTIPRRVQVALGKRAVELMLTPDQQKTFHGWKPKAQRQAKVVAFLLDIWDELRSGQAMGKSGQPDPIAPSSASRKRRGGASSKSRRPPRASSNGSTTRSKTRKRAKTSGS